MEKNSINFLPGDLFRDTAVLGVLNLASNLLRNLARDLLNANGLLKKLYLSRNSLSSDALAALNNPGIERLAYLDLSFNELGSLPASIMTHLASLNVLSLRGNAVAGVHRLTFEGMVSLAVLDLSNNTLRALETESLQPLQSLQQLGLDGNNLVCTCDLKSTVEYMKNRSINLIQTTYCSDTNSGRVYNIMRDSLDEVCKCSSAKLVLDVIDVSHTSSIIELNVININVKDVTCTFRKFGVPNIFFNLSVSENDRRIQCNGLEESSSYITCCSVSVCGLNTCVDFTTLTNNSTGPPAPSGGRFTGGSIAAAVILTFLFTLILVVVLLYVIRRKRPQLLVEADKLPSAIALRVQRLRNRKKDSGSGDDSGDNYEDIPSEAGGRENKAFSPEQGISVSNPEYTEQAKLKREIIIGVNKPRPDEYLDPVDIGIKVGEADEKKVTRVQTVAPFSIQGQKDLKPTNQKPSSSTAPTRNRSNDPPPSPPIYTELVDDATYYANRKLNEPDYQVYDAAASRPSGTSDSEEIYETFDQPEAIYVNEVVSNSSQPQTVKTVHKAACVNKK